MNCPTMRVFVFLLVAFYPLLTAAQAPATEEKTFVWAPSQERVFSNDPRKADVSVKSLWHPSSAQFGDLLYQVKIEAEGPKTAVARKAKSQFLVRLSHCDLFINIADADSFRILTIPIELSSAIDDTTGYTVSLSANSSFSMKVSDYRRFRGEGTNVQGAWSLSIACPQ
jgi:hypothetical protein